MPESVFIQKPAPTRWPEGTATERVTVVMLAAPDAGGSVPDAPAHSRTVLLDERGRQISSEDFAALLGRWRDDGVAPTASVGMPLAAGVTLQYDGDINQIQFIEQTGGAKLNITYYS